MKAEVKNIKGCVRIINIEVSAEELSNKFDQVYADIRKSARIPGFRPGKAPRDLLETRYSKEAQEEVIKRSIPEYYLRSIKEKSLTPVAPPEIENVQFKNHTLIFTAKVDVKPELKLKDYKKLRVIKKKLEIGEKQIEEVLQRLRNSKAKEKQIPDLNDKFAQDLGFNTLVELKVAVEKNLQADAQNQIKTDMERQVLDAVLEKASLAVPQSLVDQQTQELVNQFKLNRILQGEKKEDVESKIKELEDEAGKEAVRRVKLSFILEEIAAQQDIQVSEEDLEKRIEQIALRTGKNKQELRKYLERQNLLPGLRQELRDRKTIEFLLREAKVEGK